MTQGWRCFHCDFFTEDEKEASGHFGDRDDGDPICRTWSELNTDGRLSEYQSAIRELAEERDENCTLRQANESLEESRDYYKQQLEGRISSRIPGATDLNEAFFKYDSMEGRALLAEERLRAMEMTRQERQVRIGTWCVNAFGLREASHVTQRGIRLLEEAGETAQATGVELEMAHKIIDYVWSRPVGKLWQEIGGVGTTLLALAQAAGLDADLEEFREMTRVLSKPLEHFTQRNKAKNDAGFLVVQDDQ
jgi:hypothetical protein